MAVSKLRDRRILIVEDEYIVAMSLSHALESLGAVLIGPVPSVEKAVKAIESAPDIDAAILDLNLDGVMAYAVADLLLSRNIPFVFSSGYETDVLRARYPQIRSCPKPCAFPKLEEALARSIAERKRRATID